MNFSEASPTRFGYQYFLVFVDTLSYRVEDFPTKSETDNVVIKYCQGKSFPDLVFLSLWGHTAAWPSWLKCHNK